MRDPDPIRPRRLAHLSGVPLVRPAALALFREQLCGSSAQDDAGVLFDPAISTPNRAD